MADTSQPTPGAPNAAADDGAANNAGGNGVGGAHAHGSGLGVWLWGLAIFAVALALRAEYLRELWQTPFADELTLLGDSRYYHSRALEIAGGNLVGDWPAYLGPGFCWFLGTVYWLFGESLLAAKSLQAVLGATTCVLLYCIGRRLFGTAAGVLAGFGLSLYGLHIYYTGLLLPTTLVAFLNVAFVAVLVGDRTRPTPARAAAAGALLGLAAAAKANALLLGGVGWLWFLLAFSDQPRARRLLACVAFTVGMAAAIAPFSYRNYLAGGHFVLLTTSGGVNLVKGNGPTANGTHVGVPQQFQGEASLARYNRGRVDVDRAVAGDRAMTRWALGYMMENPARTLAGFARKLELFFNSFELSINDQFYFARDQIPLLALPLPGYALVAPLGLAALFLPMTWRRGRWVVVMVLAVHVASFVLLFVLARYRIVAICMLLLLASSHVVAWVDALARKRWASVAVSVVATLLCAGFVMKPETEFSERRGFATQYRFLGDRSYIAGDYPRAIEAYRGYLERPDDRFWGSHYEAWLVQMRLGSAYERTRQIERAHVTLTDFRKILERAIENGSDADPDETAGEEPLEELAGDETGDSRSANRVSVAMALLSKIDRDLKRLERKREAASKKGS